MKPAGGAKGANSNGASGTAKDSAATNDSFNKHYNKELKVAEGRSPLVSPFRTLFRAFRGNPARASRAERECPDLHIEGTVRQCLAASAESARRVGRR